MVDPAGVLFGTVLGGFTAWAARKDEKGNDLLEKVKVLKPPFYKKITLDMATARNELEFNEVADFIIVDNKDASVACYARLNEKNFDKLDLRKYSRFQGTLWRFFITNSAGTGNIDLLLCRGLAFLATEREEEKLVPFFTIRSDKDSHFTGAIDTNDTEEENLTGLISGKIKITSVVILSDQQLDYRVIFYSTDAFADTDLDVDSLIDEVELDLLSYGWRVSNTGKYCMVVTGLDIDYIDDDGSDELHVALQNLSSTSKTAGGDGEVILRFIYEERD